MLTPQQSRATCVALESQAMIFEYSAWRHGGWYVHNVCYASGAIGCVSRNYVDGKWRIACDARPFEERPTFRTRDDAARAEYVLAEKDRLAKPWRIETPISSGGWAQCGWVGPFATEAEAKTALARETARNDGRVLRITQTEAACAAVL